MTGSEVAHAQRLGLVSVKSETPAASVPTEPDAAALDDDTCHCGEAVHVYEDGFSRGLCYECSTVRCDTSDGFYGCPDRVAARITADLAHAGELAQRWGR